ncbi:MULTISPECIES: UDP-N-acetylglucosamine 1-carboxyvinyltransferase [Paenibacillus]|jgi:UDP-N-acetylglucosamine 1-carboxyvinyltransferase|uniref:UDP-N-acetylglucosamine 1-carboxyvinyltransferase n=1 Tax=Paenibacillus odorifer TaxID=189426 RepID=A0A1R0XGX3_9BACL|nr:MULTISPECIES: UDP-N-acetylglucosamine 1-carboxyvinyltransferase [Paenibacillus]AIQ71909.1 UDP-N-acetylglucosamine 1-carboxyvinyltransferase [Paenibacillus odorifer]AWV31258.1 UDP-N-acetylglucosamine 1-carboxyvinyltransferase [Paenibacillus odorifer]ETT62982.1 UDP-N-acetylglucosamine 1-carboxyvinyltransferase [Paenibacillus sp. FSL H8-237]MDH6431475.1 UDP-N-acetylglucosamine 1-carboxyvinyltransferase [Paenibacillus sp. PastH-4]MDH6447515.1 UDP-N-acetylglucosamine 1-carboxyvinyltransferase [P
MEKLMIGGGRPLEGVVTISGAKNSAIALIPAAILAESEVVLDNLPSLSDVAVYSEILQELGANVSWSGNQMRIDPSRIVSIPMPNGPVKKLRASYYMMGALLGRFKEATIGLPGGCNFEPRPIDQHIKGFEALGATVTNEHGSIHLYAKELRGAKIYLDVSSVGATINIMLAASRAKGSTIIENAAKEPEIIDVATLLNSMGAVIKGAGTETIRIEGVSEMHGCRHSIIPDRIQAGTYMIAAAATRGNVLIDNVIPKHLEALTAKLLEMGVDIEELDESIRVIGRANYEHADVKALTYPGFPTDLQSPMTSMLTQAEGVSVLSDFVYSNRFKHVPELVRMGAKIRVEGRSAIIEGSKLNAAKVKAADLRAGAALVIAGLTVEDGITEVTGVEYIDRGYDNLVSNLRQLGAHVWRENE